MKTLIIFLSAIFLSTVNLCAQPCTATIMSTSLPSGCDSLWVQVVDSPGCNSWSYVWTTGDTGSTLICCVTGVYQVYVYPVSAGCCSTMSAMITCPAPQTVEKADGDILEYVVNAGRNILTLNNISVNCTANIYEVTGKKIKTVPLGEKQRSVVYSDLPNGLYLAVIYQENNLLKAIKLLKQ